ncbi:MAG: hypothetical protein R3318_02645 [Gammaproteobacteria bacterium]|nr:hypothetical protein [Gammaproteobacteria bacterium]
MNTKRFVLAVVGAFIFIFVFEMLWHGFLMKGLYQATISIWRPQAETDMRLILVSQFLFATVMAYIYTLAGKHFPDSRGITYGALIGLLFATVDLGSYSYLPVPFSIVAMWMGASILKGLGAGIVIGLVYKEQTG